MIRTGDKHYFMSLVVVAVCTYAWHKGFPELSVGVVLMLLLLIYEKLDATS
jgi:hypothetical protein